MAKEYNEDLGQTKRISPYKDLPAEDGDQQQEFDDAYDQAYDEAEYDDAYGDEAYDAYDEEYDEYDEEYDEYTSPSGVRGFLSTTMGKIAVTLLVLLLIVLIGLVAFLFIKKGGLTQQDPKAVLPERTPYTTEITSRKNETGVIFAPQAKETDAPVQAPVVIATEEPTAEPTAVPTKKPTPKPTPEPTEVPEPTATPLPIILTNTPTPSPSPTPTAVPTPTPTPAPTATPKPSAVPEMGKGEVNRDANLRETASSNGKVKKKVDEGETVTIHGATLDKTNKVWYLLTVDDLDVSGWMRDYVVNTEDKIAAPTHTPKPTATPAPEKQEEEVVVTATPEPTAEPKEGVIGTGITVKEANVRKVMNGKVLVQLRKGRAVDIYSVRQDKNGDVWFEVQSGGGTKGFVRDYLIRLDEGVEIDMPVPTPKPTNTPAPQKEETKEEPENKPEEEKKEEDLLDREVIGKAATNRAANIRVKPRSNAKLVRQLSKGIELLILDVYQDADGHVWYEVATESGRTHGFVRDYVLDVSEIDKNREAKVFEE